MTGHSEPPRDPDITPDQVAWVEAFRKSRGVLAEKIAKSEKLTPESLAAIVEAMLNAMHGHERALTFDHRV